MQYQSRNHSYTQIILRRVVLRNSELTTRTMASEIDVNVFPEAVNDAREVLLHLCCNLFTSSFRHLYGNFFLSRVENKNFCFKT